MAEKINATCSICGVGYYQCLSCKDVMNLNPWKKHTDTSEHYKIYQVIHGFSTKVYSKEEAKSKLQKIDLSDFDSFRDNIKAIIKDIMTEEKQKEDIIETFDDVSIENIIEKDEISLIDIESVIPKETKVISKRKSLKVVEVE